MSVGNVSFLKMKASIFWKKLRFIFILQGYFSTTHVESFGMRTFNDKVTRKRLRSLSDVNGEPSLPNHQNRVLILDAIDKTAAKPLFDRDFRVDFQSGLSDECLAGILKNYDGVIVRSANTITQQMINDSPNLRVIGRAGVGVDNIDVSAATDSDVFVVNAPNGNSVAVAEHTFALMLGVARRLCEANSSLAQGKWEKKNLMGLGLKGKTLGILGFGSIGKEVAARAQVFGMKVITTDCSIQHRHNRNQDKSDEALERQEKRNDQLRLHGITPLSFEDVLKESDFVSLHVPLTGGTKGLLGKSELELMKSSAILIHVARGGVVDEKVLFSMIKEGHLGGAGLDVFLNEGNPVDPIIQELARLPNVLCTPHIGAATPDAGFEVLKEVCVAVASVLEGSRPAPECIVTPTRQDCDRLLDNVATTTLKN